jgi:[NiFe] hydrogenase assembly HybE family chaperone
VGFAPWQGHWLGVMVTPWFINLILAPGDATRWHALPQGEKRCYRFPAGDFDFIGARDKLAGDYQLCSLFSPVLQFDDQPTARRVAQLARDALFDAANAEPDEVPVANLPPAKDAGPGRPGPLSSLSAPQSKRDFLRGRVVATLAGNDRADRG